MREIRMTGSTELELKRGIEFILNNQEYKESIKQITHIIVEDYALFAFSLNERLRNEPGLLPIPTDTEGFASMAALWWSGHDSPEVDTYCDGTIEKGFILSSGKDWGELNIENDFGVSNDRFEVSNKKHLIKMNNIACITILINNEEWGK